MRRSMPRMYASAAARYCSRENSSVTLIGTPAKIDSSIAGTPAGVPGILMKRFGRAAAACSRAAALIVPRCRRPAAVRPRATPSRRRRRSPRRPVETGRRPASGLRSASSVKRASPDLPGAPSVGDRRRRRQLPLPIACVEDRRIRGQPGDATASRCSARSVPFVEHLAADVVEPEALAEVVKSSRVGVHHVSSLPFARRCRRRAETEAAFTP